MEPPAVSSNWTEKRLQLLDWFHQNTPSLVGAYEGAVKLLGDASFPGRTHFIGHALRDISDRLIFALDREREGDRVQYVEALDGIEKDWPKLTSLDEENLLEKAPEISVDYATACRIDALVAEHRKFRKRPSNQELLFRRLMQNEPSQAGPNERLAKDFKRLSKWFMARAHLRRDAPDIVDENELQLKFSAFEDMLYSFVGDFFVGMTELDTFLRAAKQEVRVDELAPKLSSPQHEVYFFERLDNPNWILPLKQHGFFDHPPNAERVEEGTRFPFWPASSYLARMAGRASSEVAAIFSRIKTDNAWINDDIANAALAMRVEFALDLVPVICRAAEAGSFWNGFDKATDLCVRMADTGHANAALLLVDAIFAPKFREGDEEPRRRDMYWVNTSLEKVIPALAREKPHEFLPTLCRWLNASIKAKTYTENISGSDFSYSWRPAIEEHEQNSDYDFAGLMVGFVRQGFEEAIRAGAISLEAAIAKVEKFSYLVFKRLKIHLLNEFANQDVGLARRTILNKEVFDDYQFKHEYAMLAGNRLDLLQPDEKSKWFGWIDAGPDMVDYDERFEANQNRKPTEDDRQDRVHYWQFEKLHWVRSHLVGDRKEFYDKMLAEFGEPELADLNVKMGAFHWGDESPISLDNLSAMSFEQAIQTVAEWKPESDGFRGPNVEGLASIFERFVATNPSSFSSQSHLLIGRPAIFVRRFIGQMQGAIQVGAQVDLPAVIGLCRWVVQQPIREQTMLDNGNRHLVDQDWQWTRNEISRLIESICRAANTEGKPRFSVAEFRESLQLLVEATYKDSADSNISRNADDDPRLHDYLDVAINAPRGKAVEAILEYARWIAKQLEEHDGKTEVVPGRFNSIPEVRSILEWQIAPENRTVEALAVIGSRISVVFWIDRTWLVENAARLFDLGNVDESHLDAPGWAAWNAFLVWERPHIDFYRILKPQFAVAVTQASKIRASGRSRELPLNHLGEHLMLLFGRGNLTLDDDDGIVRRFLIDSMAETRRHAIEFVGRTMDSPQPVPEAVTKRFMDLWEFYWPTLGTNDAKRFSDSYLFGTWFASGQFPPQWALEQLEQFVAVSPIPEPQHEVAKEFSRIAGNDVGRSVRILDRIIRGDPEGWRVRDWAKAGEQTLKLGLKELEARSLVLQLIDYLGRRGFVEFGALLAP